MSRYTQFKNHCSCFLLMFVVDRFFFKCCDFNNVNVQKVENSLQFHEGKTYFFKVWS